MEPTKQIPSTLVKYKHPEIHRDRTDCCTNVFGNCEIIAKTGKKIAKHKAITFETIKVLLKINKTAKIKKDRE